MVSVDVCRTALDELAEMLASVDPELRARHVPKRIVVCRLSDIDHAFIASMGPDGLHDLRDYSPDDDPAPDVRVTMTSDELLALAHGDEDFLHGWLRGRIQVSASMRDLLRLRSLFGL